jgi:hypothetical protein
MTDPLRLMDEGVTDFEAKLLRAGRRDAPTRHARRKILAGLGVGGLFSTLAVSTVAEGSARGWLFAAGGGAASAIAIWAGVSALAPAKEAPPAALAVATSVPQAPLRTLGPVEPAAPVPLPAANEAPVPVRAARSLPKADGLSGEIAALEGARRSLAGGKPQHALRALDDYARAYPERRLASEASVLRIEALVAAGEMAKARRLGEDFLRTHPNGPYEKRVRSLIDGPSP